MAQPPDLARKVRQLDNDVQAIYEMLAGISANLLRQGNRIEEIAHGQSEQNVTLADHGSKLDGHGSKLDQILEILERR